MSFLSSPDSHPPTNASPKQPQGIKPDPRATEKFLRSFLPPCLYPTLPACLPCCLAAWVAWSVRRYTEEQTKYKLSQKGVTIRATETPVDATFETEEDIFSFLGLDYIPPHLRWA